MYTNQLPEDFSSARRFLIIPLIEYFCEIPILFIGIKLTDTDPADGGTA